MQVEIQYLDHVEASECENLDEMLISVNRCAAVAKGGRRFSFSGLTVVGNRDGIVGYGFGKANQVPMAIEKAGKDGRKHLQRVPVVEAGTIPHEVQGRFCGANVRLIPASDGTGLIAGQSVRAVCEMAGIRNILSKSFGSSNPINLVKATLVALGKLRTAEEVASLRGVEL
ncbi:MAG: 30S ribosomal protein S5 [Planctomycetota bacterium]|nr:30S ribosomal protein S5 [Planctomycetota bacterium]MDG2142024.1 30S ribosomal protein S5 [Planctomycetota bacterium]